MSQYHRIVVLTGAGISAESGIATFRGSDGLWNGHAITDVATPEGFARNPKLVHTFYNDRRRQLAEVKANPAHHVLAEFQKSFDGEFTLVTQNVDDLHERGGSENVLHMHGELKKVRCVKSGEILKWEQDLFCETVHPHNSKLIGTLRPHIVWFGEMPLYMEEIEKKLSQCDLFIAIGTSGQVYPAAGFVQMTPHGCKTVEINLEPTVISSYFSESHFGPASIKVPEFLHKIALNSI